MISLNTEITAISGIGSQRANAFSRLGIKTVEDLISSFPRTYEDRRAEKPIAHLMVGDSVCVRAMVADSPRLQHIRQGMDLVKFRIVDSTGSLNVTYFNQTYIKNNFVQGKEYVFFGTVSGSGRYLQFNNPIAEPVEKAGQITGRLIPVYRLTAGLTQRVFMHSVKYCLDSLSENFPDYLPPRICRQYNLCSAAYAYRNIHFPDSEENVEISRRRLIFEEFFVLACAMGLMRSERTVKTGCNIPAADIKYFYSSLPFTPTQAQQRAIKESISDMSRDIPMNRLIQGDVGSGKTLVATACMWNAAVSGFQSAFMAPTEILARQHYNTLCDVLNPMNIRVGLLTGSMTQKQKGKIYSLLSTGEIDIIVGTHALITDKVTFSRLGLVITDEQHRFGVRQRSALAAKGNNPHTLVMSATPIPRTLALIIYGDLDVSIIDEMPPGRQPVDTYVVSENMRQRIYNFIRRLVSEGRQVYIICPMVEENEAASDLKSVKDYTEQLKAHIFPDLTVDLLHGKMKTAEKEKVMSRFSSGEIQVLVATTVVEVGVDVPNASLMVIENADRFGLSQLHQLRGRVGRGQHKSYCVLFEESGNEASIQRLKVMCKTNDGFKISEEDLKLRGPGDFFGSRQHGLPEMKIADLSADMSILTEAQSAAGSVLREDPLLSSPENSGLQIRIKKLFESGADTL